MKVLGISGKQNSAAAAVVVDGEVRAAASEDVFTRMPGVGYASTGGYPASAVAACLAAAGCRTDALDEVVIVEDDAAWRDAAAAAGLNGRVRVRSIAATTADAVHAAMAHDEASHVLVCGTEPAVFAAYSADGQEIVPVETFPARDWAEAARRLARELGVESPDALMALDRLSVGGDAGAAEAMRAAVAWHPKDRAVHVDLDGLGSLVREQARPFPNGLSDASSLNVRLQATRRGLAASFLSRTAEIARDAASAAFGKNATQPVFGGALFASPRVNTELFDLLGPSVKFSPVPERMGRALGAALSSDVRNGGRSTAIAAGSGLDEAEVKRVLDNCRLDYVYELDWQRLLDRVSRMLSQGKVVAWFQGPMSFGPRSAGSRSILADPSNRYARHNVNEYLCDRPLDEPLPVALAPSAVAEVLVDSTVGGHVVRDVLVNPALHAAVIAALDWRQRVRLLPAVGQSTALSELLEHHRVRTGVPGLIETPLAGPGEPLACTAREAVRTVYSSAVDALVIGRFLLMKDHWLLRSEGA